MITANDLRGPALLHDARFNKGSAFTQAERDALGLNGLLPDQVEDLHLQVARVISEVEVITDDLQKYLFLSDLQGRNQTLYYAVLMSDPARFMPLVYTPTVGEACQKFDHFFRGTPRPVPADHRQGPGSRADEELAGTGRTLHRRHRRRAHPRPG